ncbi:transposase [Paraburkholderia bengalensis]|uniref:Transposase n=1 Tax=Paraburkholderia bengalensis TaxID=2747562 RepID=A0ABU8J491_9BURK
MFFDELSNDEWAQLSALVSDEPAVRLNRRGRPRAEPRIVTNAVLWILTTGEPWSKLPGRYPSGPTCRRRFEEWQANGTLAEIIRLLTLGGRTFAYIPEPTPPAAPKPAPVAEAPKPRDELARGVFWKSPETWQAGAQDADVARGAPSGWRALAPMADITRQLAGSAAVETGFVDTRASRAPAAAAFDARAAFGEAEGFDASVGAVHVEVIRSSDTGREPYACDEPQDTRATSSGAAVNGHHTPLWMSLTAPRGLQVADRQGYVIYVAAEQVPNNRFRAWAEIMKDGKRIERSGLIGPRFTDADAAHRFALDWARQWIDHECRTRDAAPGADAGQGMQPMQPHADLLANGTNSVPNATPKSVPRPVTRPLPELTPTPALAASNVGASTAGNPHLPQHLNPRLMPLRRYPSDTVSDKSGERYPFTSILVSHAG